MIYLLELVRVLVYGVAKMKVKETVNILLSTLFDLRARR